MFQRKMILGLLIAITAAVHSAQASHTDKELPILVIGASYSNGKTPFNNGTAPLGGVSVNFGDYLDLGTALARNKKLPGFVINEGQAGATTFARVWCPPGAPACSTAGWDSYSTMLNKVVQRVALPPAFNTYNAKYVVITTANDCLHSDAFGIPQDQAVPCTTAQLNQVVSRLIAVGQEVIAKGLIPIYDIPAKYTDLDMATFKSAFGLTWVIDENSYSYLRNTIKNQIPAALPTALVLDIWKKFEHLPDGLHPTRKTVEKASDIVAHAIRHH